MVYSICVRWNLARCLASIGLTMIALSKVDLTADTLSDLKQSLTFHASFDSGVDADFAKGDKRLYTCLRPNNQSEAQPGLNTENKTLLLSSGGVSGGALKFTERNSKWIFYPGAENVHFTSKNWSGSLSVWLRLDPEEDLDPGFTDPIQITPRKWNDAAFFFDFDKAGNPRDFRLGAFPDLTVWNSKNENVNDIPEDQRPLVKVKSPPFGSHKWTHVVFTWNHFNTKKKDGVAQFYLDGKPTGAIKGWEQTFSWKDNEEVRLFLGLNYIGLLDEVSLFDRALTPEEVQHLFQLDDQIKKVIP